MNLDFYRGKEAAETDADVATILRDMRDLRVTISQSSEKLGRLEKRLRAALKDT